MAKQQRRPKVQRTCKQCGKQFLAHQYAVDIGRGVFCSQRCSWQSKARPKVQRTCKQCGEAFVGRRGSVFCSNKCTTEANRSKVQRSCKQCGNTFLVAPNQIANGGGIYCSRKCMGKAQTSRMPVYTCQCCGKVFSARKTKPERKYCSRACAAKSTRGKEGKRGDGRTHKHDKWGLAVILRDKKCVRCGALETLQAHHLKPWKHNPELRYDTDNGVALCPLCHHAQHPYLPLERFVASGGKEVKYCVVCEDAFLVKRKTQRVCSRKCGWKRKKQMSRQSA